MATDPALDVPLLQSIYLSSAVAKAALDSFASRSYRTSETTVDRLLGVVLESNSSSKRQDVVEFLRQLQTASCGAFKIGRRGSASRFVWTVSLVDVGLAAQGKKSAVELAAPQEVKSAPEPDDVTFTHVFQLRLNQRVEFRLPTDLTQLEAGRLADFLKTLPLEAS